MADGVRASLGPMDIRVLREAVSRDGEDRVAVDSGMSKTLLYRALAGLPVNPGSRVKVNAYLDRERTVAV